MFVPGQVTCSKIYTCRLTS